MTRKKQTDEAQATVRVRCPQCTLEDEIKGQFVPDADSSVTGPECVNCGVPMVPIGDVATATAEQAFKEAQQELAADGKVETTMPPSETVETLTKRLNEIERARDRVIRAQCEYESCKEASKEAKKHYDDEVTTFLSLTGRLSVIAAPLPLFTAEAEQAAVADAPSVFDDAHEDAAVDVTTEELAAL